MTAPDEEMLMRWSDGELSPEEARRLEAAALTDANLAARMSALRRLRAAAREAFAVTVDPRDRDLARLIAAQSARKRAADDGPRPVWARWPGALLAPRVAAPWAGLAVAAFVGGLLIGPGLTPGDGLRVAADGALRDRELVRVLDRRLASEGPDGDGRAVGLTFQDAERRWCRTFQAREAGMAGLACRESGAWTVRVLAPLDAPGGEVRTAASDLPEAVLMAVDAVIDGPSADAAGEARARDAGWPGG
jgi:hypothetical protein